MVDFGFATMAIVLGVNFLEAPRDDGGYAMSKISMASCIAPIFPLIHFGR